jgi:Calcineurin-like phosphoesterase
MRRLAAAWLVTLLIGAVPGSDITAQQPVPGNLVTVRAIQPPDAPLPSEADSARISRFSFIAYGDTRSQVDGQALQPDHGVVVDTMLATIRSLESTPFPIRFVLQSGDAVTRGTEGAQWNVSFSPLIEKLTRRGNVPYFLAVGNHDVTPADDPTRTLGLQNSLAAMSKLIPPEGSLRRLNGYPTYAFGYGNLFAIAIDSNIASDVTQFEWVTDQLEHLDRTRYRHLIAFFHHPLFSSGPHGGVSPGLSAGSSTQDNVERPTAEMRTVYAPLFRRYHVRMTITGHDHLYDHWVERYTETGISYRRDDLVTGGGGAPIYTYRGEPEMQAYLAAGADRSVQVQHLTKPGVTAEENPHHFVVVQVDGDRLSFEVIGTGANDYRPYNGRSRIELNDPN